MKEGRQGRGSSRLTCQISCECVHCVGFRWPKTTIFGILGVKFGALKQTERLHLQAKFHLNAFIVSASGGQKPQFGANFDFWGLLYQPPFTNEGQIWCAEADRTSILTCQIWNFIWMSSLCRLPVAENHNFGHILTFGGSCTDPLLPMRAKFGILKQNERNVYTYTLNFIWIYSLSRLPVAQNHNFGHILTFGGSCTDPLLPMRAKFGML